MSEFGTTLRSQVEQRFAALVVARDAGHDYEVHLHGARIRDLLEMAARHGVDTRGWVDPAVLDSADLTD
ncbi:hypothetical protein [Allokutzneria albata]|uniref:Uncharacterized protein n=1 Tax=Allokutzneria albata TaxID=211114 RepID=A0A1G9SC70_ALLAB|nr:hypothetical protein [Allokutzneria albata]SDM33068.1 hypothetical protein SAMN04489726_1062 [Allokutzneria albata]